MEILPAIDLRDGQVVRLAQGDYDRQTTYAADPAAVAHGFVEAGARWIHVVDLDAARSGTRANADAIAAVVTAAGDAAAVELGGGIRDDDAVQAALSLGVARVVIGSAALKDRAWFQRLTAREDLAGKVVLGLDARRRRLAVHGWADQTEVTVAEIAAWARSLPLAAIIYTDIDRDGMLSGPDLATTAELIDTTDLPVIASGGIRSIADVAECRKVGCAGAIVGRAWYEGQFDLPAACELARK